MYKVIKSFSDIQDNGFVYQAGDTFPRFGKEVSAERLKELSSTENKRGEKLIDGASDPVEEKILDSPDPVKDQSSARKGKRRKNVRTDFEVD